MCSKYIVCIYEIVKNNEKLYKKINLSWWLVTKRGAKSIRNEFFA